MRRFYEEYDQRVNNPCDYYNDAYQARYNPCDNFANHYCCHNCFNSSYDQDPTRNRYSNRCGCETCQNSYPYQYDWNVSAPDAFMAKSNPWYSEGPSRLRNEQEVNQDCVNKALPMNNAVDRNPLNRKRNYQTPPRRNIAEGGIYSWKNPLQGAGRSFNIITTPRASGVGLPNTRNQHVDFSNDHTSKTADSFHSCLPCDSHQIETVFDNKRGLSSKSTVNQSSNQSIESNSSRSILKTRVDQKNDRKKNNSGYFEVVSPTRVRSINNPRGFPANNPASPNFLSKRPIHYGYFEVKEKRCTGNTAVYERNPVLLELDKVPTKISKQIDTSHFKQSTMLDKSLSANMTRNDVKTSDKALTVDLGVNSPKEFTQSDLLKIVKTISKKQSPQVKTSDKMVQSISDKSLTSFKATGSATKEKSHGVCKRKLKAARSLSEGSINARKRTAAKQTKDKVASYRNYLDAALGKLETQISKRIKSALTYCGEEPRKKSLVTIFQCVTDNAGKRTACDQKRHIGINCTPSMQSLEDIIDSEEVEVNTSDFEERSATSLADCEFKPQFNCGSDNSSFKVDNSPLTSDCQNFETANSEDCSGKSYEAIREDQTHELVLISQKSPQCKNPSCKRINPVPSVQAPCSVQNTKPSPCVGSKQTNTLLTSRNQACKTEDIQIWRGFKVCRPPSSRPRQCPRAQPKLTVKTSCRRQLERDSFSARRSTCTRKSPVSARGVCDGARSSTHKSSDCRDNTIRFNRPSLGTIEEESETSSRLSVICGNKADQTASFNSVSWADADSNITSCSRYRPKQPPRAISCYDRRAGYDELSNLLKCSRCNAYRPSDHLFDVDRYENCPKRRYNSQFCSPYDAKSYTSRSPKRRDQLYNYMLDVPPYRQQNQVANVKLVNIISFVVFIVVFYGIFQYIDAGIRSGKFP